MTITTSDKAVADYLDNLLNELPPIDVPDEGNATFLPWQPADTVDTTCRMVPSMDVFELMAMAPDQNQSMSHRFKHLTWLSIHLLLPISARLPNSTVKQYLIRQCQTLLARVSS